METPFSWFFWFFPIAFTFHNIEEAIWFPAFSKSAGKFHKPVDKFEFAFAVIILTLLSIIITLLFSVYGKLSIACYLYFAFNFGMLVNVFFPHFIATVVLKKYCPGLLTGIILLIPTTTYILFFGYSNKYFEFPKFWFIAIPFTLLIIGSIPFLFKFGKLVNIMLEKYSLK